MTAQASQRTIRIEAMRFHYSHTLEEWYNRTVMHKDEIVEIITHMAFYSGWPTAMSAAGVAKSVLEGGDKK